MSSNVIVWFRDDLRLSDHPALHEAAKSGAGVIGLYVLEDSGSPVCELETRPLGGAARWWLAQSLRRLIFVNVFACARPSARAVAATVR